MVVNIRLAILAALLLALVGLDLYAGSKGVILHPLGVANICLLLGSVVTALVKMGGNGPTPA